MAKDLTIFDPKGNKTKVESLQNVTHVESAVQQIDGQNSDVVNVTIRSSVPVDYEIGSYLNVYDRRYWLNKKGTIRKVSESDFTCTFKFEGIQYQLARSSYDLNLDPTHTDADLRIDSLMADLERFVEIIIMSSQEATPGLFVMGKVPQNTEEKTLSFSDEDSCLSALQRLCQEYDTFFTFTPLNGGTSYAINVGQEGDLFPHTFRYGSGHGIYTLDRANVDDGNIINRLKVAGSSTNIVAKKYRSTELLLPGKIRATSYVEDAASIAKYGMWVGKKTFDDIYPHRTGVVSSVGEYNTFVDKDMDFDLNATDESGETLYLLAGETAKIHFNTGQLAGYEFDMVSYDHATKTFRVKAYETESGYKIPNETDAAFQIAAGDKYVITNIFMPQSYITKAEEDLLAAAEKYLAQESRPEVKYSLTLSTFFLRSYMDYDPNKNIFWIGDLIHIIDEDLAIDAKIRITGITRDLLNPYDYTLTIADTMTTTTVATQIINELKNVDRTLTANNLFDAARTRRNWKDQQELLSMIFDPDGYFTDKIRPLSVETSMLAVGAKSMQLGLVGTTFEPNYYGQSEMVRVIGGSLVHYGIEETPRQWKMANVELSLGNEGAYYIYAICSKNGDNGRWSFTQSTKKVDEGDGNYNFLVGVLNSVDEETDTRSIALTYGFTTINGRFIKTGRIQSADGVTYFDLDSGEIGGKIVFTRNQTQLTINDLASESLEAKNYINNTLPGLLSDIQAQLDGQIEQFFFDYDPTAGNEPTKTWIEEDEEAGTATVRESHLGDLFYNTSTGKVFRYVVKKITPTRGVVIDVYDWQELQDSEVAAALAAANDALALAKTKRRIFTSTPYPPYEVGDLWCEGSKGDIMRCITSRETGSYSASDWDKASKYTDDTTISNFINNTYATQISTITTQIDGKIESWFQAEDPARDWSSDELKGRHVGDMWYNTTEKTLQRYSSAFQWGTVEDATAIAAYNAASNAQDTADGKRTVFLETPQPPYDRGDLWTNGESLKRCIRARAEGTFVESDWGLATNYDNTKTTIDGGVVTSGTVQLAADDGMICAGASGEGTDETSVRFWAGATKENRASAPFRVLNNGKVTATNADITGKISASDGEIGGFNISSTSITSKENTNNIVLNGKTGQVRFAGGNFTVDASGNVSMKNVSATGGTYSGVINMSGGMILPVTKSTARSIQLENSTTVLITDYQNSLSSGQVNTVTLPAKPNIGQVLTILNSNRWVELRVDGNGNKITPSCVDDSYWGGKQWAPGRYFPIGVLRAKQLIFDGSQWWQINGFNEW